MKLFKSKKERERAKELREELAKVGRCTERAYSRKDERGFNIIDVFIITVLTSVAVVTFVMVNYSLAKCMAV